MKKTHIRILVSVMSAALIGLLAVQWSWVSNAVTLQEQQFDTKVTEAMHAVVERLQDREVSMAMASGHFLTWPFRDPFAMVPNHGRGPHHHLSSNSPESKRPVKPDSVPRRIVQRQVSTTSRFIDGKWVEEKSVETTLLGGENPINPETGAFDPDQVAYLQDIVNRLLHGAIPIHQRIDPRVIDTLLRDELRRRDIEEDFVYGISQERFALPGLVRLDADSSKVNHDREFFRVQLFPHDIRPSDHYLEIQFPSRQSMTIRAMGLVLPTSGALVLIVMGCFGIALIAFRRQQKLSDLKTDFINNMTHELKTPISTISLALEVLNDPAMQTKERIGLYTKVIRQENDRLKNQVERVLQAAALERGELKLEMEPIDLDALVRDHIERIRLHVEGRGGHIHYLPEATDTFVVGDEVHLGGLIFNLFDNANKYSPEAPDITVRTANVPNGIEITVTDHGIGISAEAQRRVFDKFYRVPTGNVHNVKGFGIGLSYALSMAKAHGGDIRLQSEMGKGSTFTLFLPQKNNFS